MFYVYILHSDILDRYYVGYTEVLETRLLQHNSGISTYTQKASDWVLKYSEQFETRSAAMAREKEIKNKKSRSYIEWIVQSAK